MENLYEILNIDRNATQAEIKAAYRQMAAKYHPDINSSADAEEQFKAINLAHEVLSDFYLRLQYEQEYDEFHGIESTPEFETSAEESSHPEQVDTEEEEFIIEAEQTEVKEETLETEEETVSFDEPEPIEEVEEVQENVYEEEEEHRPIFPLKWKLALLATPFIILLGIGLLKIIVTLFNPQESQAQANQKVLVEKTIKPTTQVPKKITLWELKRMAIAQPDQCISFIDSVKNTKTYQPEMEGIRKKAVESLPAKTAYFFETNECIRARNAFRLLLDNQPNLKPHTRKKLDFYNFRCAIEAKDITLAMSILDEMADRYTHQYSILAAKSQVLHHHMNQPRAALKAYQQARQLY